jgi:hypothetical protein
LVGVCSRYHSRWLPWLVSGVSAFMAHGKRRTPENALRCHIRKPQIFANFIRTILVIFYPEKGYGVRFEQFLSGRRI